MGQRQAIRDRLTYTLDALVAAILAPRCAACSSVLDRPTHGPVCDACWAQVVSAIPPPCESSELGALDRSKSAGPYDGALRQIIQALKYDGRRSLAPRLGTVLRAAGHDVLIDARCVVPVPLYPWRWMTRGFNQAADLAECLDLPVVHALWRTRSTAPQTDLTAGQRRRNVRGAFAVSPLLSARVRKTMLEGHVVVLVDDVRTTGATLDACARALKRTGVSEVRALTLALAE